MDNKRSPKETRTRRDSMSATERQSLGKGYPVRPDADTEKYRPVNHRPRKDGGQIPDYMRRGEVPIRKNITPKQLPTQMDVDNAANTSTNTATMTISRKSLHTQARHTQTSMSQAENSALPGTPDVMEQTRIISRDALRHTAASETSDTMDKTIHFSRSAFHTAQDTQSSCTSASHPATDTVESISTEENHAHASSSLGEKKSTRRVPWIPVIGTMVVLLALVITLPVARHKKNTPPPVDYSMAEGFSPDALTITKEMDSRTDADSETTENPHDDPTTTNTDSHTPETEAAKFTVTLAFFGRDSITASTGKTTLGDFLEKVGYTVRDTDKFPFDMTTELTEDITIDVGTITYGTATTTEVIPYTSKVMEVQTIPRGTKEIAQYGQNGEKTITYTITYCNGEEIHRERSGESITKSPVEEISTLGIGGTLVGADGNTYSYSHYKVCSATYYDIEGITYLGYNADESVVATDKSYIPMGTKLYVKSDTFDFGVRTAADTGSMIQGWEVDIWLADSNPQKAAFAKGGYWKDMRVYFLD